VPKAFEDDERARIREGLLREGMAQFERNGVRNARIEDVCRAVGIAKGSFYAFFPSKEELFMTIVEQREARHQADMLAHIDAAHGTARERAGGFFDLILDKIETDPVLNLVLAHGELAHLVRKLGAARFEAGQERDQAFAREAARRWQAAGQVAVSPADLIGMMTIALCVATQRGQMTGAQYAPSVALLRELFVDRLAGAER
jgi:AcrR family transcriptional regulator